MPVRFAQRQWEVLSKEQGTHGATKTPTVAMAGMKRGMGIALAR
jgi:hypothetical protein